MKPADMDEVTCARFSKDSKLLHTGSNSSVIYTWDLKQQVCLCECLTASLVFEKTLCHDFCCDQESVCQADHTHTHTYICAMQTELAAFHEHRAAITYIHTTSADTHSLFICVRSLLLLCRRRWQRFVSTNQPSPLWLWLKGMSTWRLQGVCFLCVCACVYVSRCVCARACVCAAFSLFLIPHPPCSALQCSTASQTCSLPIIQSCIVNHRSLSFTLS